MGLAIGQVLGSYRITGKIGEGGMGEVYRADHLLIARTAAIKVLRPELSSNEELLKRFFAEARATSLIRHPGIVEILDCARHEGLAYIVMEFLQGESLASLLRRTGALASDFSRLCELGARIASAIGAAHHAGIVHRDLKPDNIFITQDDRGPGIVLKILDFGIAKLNDRQGLHTRTGSIVGTPVYMSPEQCRGCGTVDGRADIYALGCILFELAARRPPFVKKGDGELLSAHLVEPPPELGTLASVPEPFAQMVAEMLAKDPDQRPQTMGEVETRLRSMMSAGADQLGGTLVPAAGQAGATSILPESPRYTPPPPGKPDSTGPRALPTGKPEDERERPSRPSVGPERSAVADRHTPSNATRHSTTLRSSAGESHTQPSGRSRVRVLSFSIAGVVLLAGAIFVLVRPGPSRQQTVPVPLVAPPTAKPPVTEPAVETVTISVEDAPPGLVARANGVDHAVPIRLRKGSPVREYRLEAPEYEPHSVVLDGSHDRVLVFEWRKVADAPGPPALKPETKKGSSRARKRERGTHENSGTRRLEAIEEL